MSNNHKHIQLSRHAFILTKEKKKKQHHTKSLLCSVDAIHWISIKWALMRTVLLNFTIFFCSHAPFLKAIDLKSTVNLI